MVAIFIFLFDGDLQSVLSHFLGNILHVLVLIVSDNIFFDLLDRLGIVGISTLEVNSVDGQLIVHIVADSSFSGVSIDGLAIR